MHVGKVYLNKKLKRKEVEKAVQVTRQSQVRFGSMGKDSESEQMQNNSLLRFPPEIRNFITEYVLDLGDDAAGNALVVCPPGPYKPLCEGSSILSLCKQTTAEARSMLEARTTAYIPIMADMNFCKLISDINENGNPSISGIQSTVFTGLTSFRHAHFHLHVNHPSSTFRQHPYTEIYVDLSQIYEVLKQAFIIWRAASEHNFAHFKEQGVKRKAVLHLDHLFACWRDMDGFSPKTRLEDLLRIMTSDTTTDWEVHYYLPVRDLHRGDDRVNYPARILRRVLNSNQTEFRSFPSMKLVPELYGDLHKGLKDAGFFTERILPSSTLWPSWPEDVPWRLCPRVRSDELEPSQDRAT
ncbi:hypothetical protein COCCADRAFT_89803 [Bipolaris zeicola 26-R-13]|uniref:Uncharacterized protein n=1 Tax=Cochliobolus carbonum (strain 26-R-13) TaxID=930089 RepID=W6YDT1_COCC2|nr:uncharacterized protein COCCADRAFT_89803 [Bipolaris zeicola 26-R-13]EUC35828.1 hypothetical protein COCCADRAFT_89803 [Bipolaris zeicola 26-R-13]